MKKNSSTVALAMVFGAAAYYASNYFLQAVQKPTVYHSADSHHTNNIFVHLKDILEEPYWPSFWFYNQHASTVAGAFIRAKMTLKYEREILDLPDGGELALDWFNHDLKNTEDKRPLLIILPGLSGSSQAPYVQHTINCVQEIGWRCAVMNYRGTAGLKLKKVPIAYCGSWTEDIRATCRHIKTKVPENTLLIGLGYSLGSNIMVKFCGEEGDKVPFFGIISVSNVFDLLACSKSIENRIVYDYILTKGLIDTYLLNKDILSALGRELNHQAIVQAKRVRDFDAHVTCQIFGYKTVDDYYNDASCVNYLDKLRIPAVFISATDDPLVPGHVIPTEKCKTNPYTLLIVTDRGGHVSFLEGIFPTGKSWCDRVITSTLESFTKQHTQQFQK